MKTELLVPAGNKQAFITAINNGADAIYLGLKQFSARGNAENFTADDLAFCVNYAKLFGVKVYAAVNTLIKNSELDIFFENIASAGKLGVDAFIVQDMLLGKFLKKKFPSIVLHLSTQGGVCNVYGAKLAVEYGFSRVILARETKFEDIKAIAQIIETEVFVQGALCSSFSGHCYMSSFIGGNSGNRGLCKQPCRKQYQYIVNGKLSHCGYALSLSDLCIEGDIKKYVDAGVKSFKIEGRMRRNEYVGTATAYYRALLDGDADKNAFEVIRRDLLRTFNRNDYTKGLAFGQPADFISDKVQGHIGQSVGCVFRKTGKDEYFVKSNECFENGDAYKILRDGNEVGAGIFLKNENNGFKMSSAGALVSGDDVRITTDVKINRKIAERQKKLHIKIFATLSQDVTAKFFVLLCGAVECNSVDRVKCNVGELDACEGSAVDGLFGNSSSSDCRAMLKLFCKDCHAASRRNCNFFLYESRCICQPALKVSLSKEDIFNSFSKTDEYPFYTEIKIYSDRIFLSKGELNEIRRRIYSHAFSYFNKPQFEISKLNYEWKRNQNISHIITNKNTSILQAKCNVNMRDINNIVLFPSNYKDRSALEEFLSSAKKYGKKTFLYFPAFATGRDIEILRETVRNFDGIYGDGYYALTLAEQWGKEFIAGCGFNVFNKLDVSELSSRGIPMENIVLSKELSLTEIKEFPEGTMCFCGGNIAVMDFAYCPFGKHCDSCNVRDILLQDDCNRKYKVVKYKLSECRFVVYNPYDLKFTSIAGKNALTDRTFINPSAEITNGNLQKGVH